MTTWDFHPEVNYHVIYYVLRILPLVFAICVYNNSLFGSDRWLQTTLTTVL